MKASLLIKNFWGTPLPISATLGGGISPSSLDLQRFAVVALKKHTHHRTIISSFLLSYLSQDLFSLLRPSAHKSFQKNKLLRGSFFTTSIFSILEVVWIPCLNAQQISVIIADPSKSELGGVLQI